MAWTIPIAASGGEGLFWLAVAIFVIISKIVQASKKNAPPTRKPDQPDAADFSPEEELRDFLKRLSPGTESVPPPMPQPQRPVPPPLPAQAARTTTSSQPGAARARQPATPTRAAAPKARPVPLPQPLPAQEVVAAVKREPVRSRAPAAAVPAPENQRRAALIADLRNRESLREAIILREILGPPLALRRLKTHAFIG